MRPSPRRSALVALALLGCGSSSPPKSSPPTPDTGADVAQVGVDAAAEAGAVDEAAFLGSWMYATGEREVTCPRASESTTFEGTTVQVERGMDAALVLTAMSHCQLKLDLAGAVAQLRPDQFCVWVMVPTGVSVLRYQSGAWTSFGGVATWQAAGSAMVATSGATSMCSFRESGTLRRALPGAMPDAGVGGVCVLNPDCPAPFVCGGERCRITCVETRDCAAGRCVRSAYGSDRFCLPDTESHCAGNGDCPYPLVCAPDRRCHNECQSAIDCPKAQPCVDHVCAEPDEVTSDGHLRPASDGGS
jgi:hypothetical protein